MAPLHIAAAQTTKMYIIDLILERLSYIGIYPNHINIMYTYMLMHKV